MRLNGGVDPKGNCLMEGKPTYRDTLGPTGLGSTDHGLRPAVSRRRCPSPWARSAFASGTPVRSAALPPRCRSRLYHVLNLRQADSSATIVVHRLWGNWASRASPIINVPDFVIDGLVPPLADLKTNRGNLRNRDEDGPCGGTLDRR